MEGIDAKTYMNPTRKGRESATIVSSDGTVRTINVIIGRDAEVVAKEAARIERKVLNSGAMITRPNGDRVSRDRRERIDTRPGVSPGKRNEWHADGDRVRCDWFEVTMTPDGERTERRLRAVWVHFDNLDH